MERSSGHALPVDVLDDELRLPVGQAQRISELERENRELRRANEILKSASASFAAELDYPRSDEPLRRCAP